MTKLILRKLPETYAWSLNGIVFHVGGGLYAALDTALALGLGQDTLENLPQHIQWVQNTENDTYETEI